MKGKIDYKTKRNIVIVAIVLALFVIASVSTYVYIRGNTETQAVSEINSMAENQNASQEQVGDTEAQSNEEQTSSEQTTTEDNTETETVANDNQEEATVTEEVASVDTDTTTTTSTPATGVDNAQTQTVTTTERVEETNTVVGFTPEDVNLGLSQLTADLPVDTTEPVYKTLGIWNDTHYNSGEDVTVATTNDSIRLRIDFEEKLATEPKVKVIGTDGTETILDCTFRPDSSSDTNFAYMADFKITEEMNLPEGEVQFEIYGYADAAGNEGATLTNEDINWDRFPKVDYDVTAPEYKKLGITNITHYYEEGSDITVAGTGDQIRVLVLFEEELATEPKVDILDSEGNVLKTVDCNFSQQTTDSVKMYSYLGNFNITEDMNLPEGEIQFVVYGYADVAGNEGKRLDNSKLNYDPYLKVVYDKTAPELEVEQLQDDKFVNTENTQINVKDVNAFTTEILDKDGNLIKARESKQREDGTYYDRFGIGWLGEGTYTVRVTDAAGNVAEETFTVDFTKPELEVEQLQDDKFVNTENTQINVKDANAFTTEILDKDGNLIKARESQQREDGTYYDRFGIGWLGEGTYIVRVTDVAGNVTEETFTVDFTKPELEVEQLQDDKFVNTENTQINVKDANAFTTEILDKDGNLIKARESQQREDGTYYDRFGIGWLGEGTYTVRVTDKAGNVTEETFTVDFTKPELEVEQLQDDKFVNTENTQINVKDANAFTTEILDKDGNLIKARESQQKEDGTYYDRFGIGWLGEGTYTVRVTDVAGNVTEETFTVDFTKPELEVEQLQDDKFVNTENTQINVKDANAFTTEILDKDGNLIKARESKQREDGTYYDRFGIGWLGEGTYTVRVTDVAGNVTEETFTVDFSDPVYTNLGIARNKDESDTRDQHYAKEGDSVRILISFEEKLAVEPTVKFAGKEYTATYRPDSSNPESNLYYYMADITMTADMPEGEMQFEVYGYADAAGNEGELLNNNKITDKTYDKVIYDMTAPYSGVEDGSHPLYILNVSDASRRQWIRNGEMLRVEANFNEDLDMSKTPVLTIGTESNTQTAEFEYKDTVDGKRRYVADIVIDNSILNLAEGTQVPFTVTNAFDKAGNEAVLDNDDVTYTNEYGQVTYDSEAPKYSAMGIVNATHYDSKEGDIHYAKTDDEVRILVQFDEKLSVEPRIRILGANNEVVKDLNCGWASQTSANLNTNAYTGQFKITDDMNLPEGEIRFEVYGYKDAAGNEGEVLDNEDLNYPGEPSIDDGVIYDKTIPAINPSYWRLQLEADKTKEFTEDMYPVLAPTDNSGCEVTVEMVNCNVDMGTPGEYKIQYVATDKAGNVAYNDIFVTVVDTTAPKLHPSYWTLEIEANKDEKFEGDLLPEVYGTDNANGKVTVELVNNTVDMGTPGEYKLQYITTDANGNKAYNDIFITVVDTTIPGFAPSEWLPVYEADKTKTFTEDMLPEITVSDNASGEVTWTVSGLETVDMGTPGKYTIHFVTTDANGLTAWNDMTITVVDTTIPGFAPSEWLPVYEADKTKTFTEDMLPEITVSDNASGEVTWTVSGLETVDMGTPGKYTIHFVTTDANGLTAWNDMTITVEDNTIPGFAPSEWLPVYEAEEGVTLTEDMLPEITVSDNAKGEVTWRVTGLDSVDMSTPGQYTITFITTDANGNEAWNGMTITVVAKEGTNSVEETPIEETTVDRYSTTNTNTVEQTSLEGTVSTSTTDNGSVAVTLTTTKTVKTPEEWEKVDDTTFTKTYSESGDYSVDISDEEGNESTVKFSVEVDKGETESVPSTEAVVEEAE